jgi:hypothetical protein
MQVNDFFPYLEDTFNQNKLALFVGSVFRQLVLDKIDHANNKKKSLKRSHLNGPCARFFLSVI